MPPFETPPISHDVSDHPQLQLFLERATTVVARCGGWNAKSRILLGDLAHELGISRQEAEPAIRTLLIATEDFLPKPRNGHPVESSYTPLPPPPPPPGFDDEGGAAAMP